MVVAEGCEDAWLVDCGDVGHVAEMIDERGLSLKGVFLTHVHYDHIYGLNELRGRYGKFAVYTNDRGKENLYNTRYNFSKFHELDFVFEGSEVEIIDDGSVVELFEGQVMEVIATPGHDWSSLTYGLGDYLFTGDSYIPGLKTVTIFPKSNKQQAKVSEELIRTKIKSTTIICPGHGLMEMMK